MVNSDPNAKKLKGKSQKEVKRKQVQEQENDLLITKVSVLAQCLSQVCRKTLNQAPLSLYISCLADVDELTQRKRAARGIHTTHDSVCMLCLESSLDLAMD